MTALDIIYWVVLTPLYALIFTGQRWAPCKCDRAIPWAFPRRHARLWVLIAIAALATIEAVVVTVARGPLTALLWYVAMGLTWWRVKVHGDGKRRWPGKVAGFVRVNDHGRLVIER